MKKRIAALIFSLVMVFACAVPAWADYIYLAETDKDMVRIIFTSDIHDYYVVGSQKVDGRIRDHGGAARLKWLIDKYRTENTIVVDAGDFSMGTLLSTGFESNASELKILGAMGYDVVTFGNHEFDYGPLALSNMLAAASSGGERIPAIVQSNLDFSGTVTEDQQAIKNYYDSGIISDTVVVTMGGNKLRVGVIGLMGVDAIECAPTSGQKWVDYKEAAKRAVTELEPKTDVIICLSHAGTDGNRETGEDMELADEVEGIDVIISGHSHTTYKKPVYRNGKVIASCGEFGQFLGVIDLEMNEDGPSLLNYKLISCDFRIPSNLELKEYVSGLTDLVDNTYLAGSGYDMETTIATSPFTFDSMDEMYSANYEYDIGNLIADAYMYEAEKHGVKDLDVAIVALGTIRNSIVQGPITAEKCFEICSLGVGSDGSVGHALVCGYVTGKELKLLTELDSSLGPYKDSIRMSYSGIKYRYNTRRIILDRVTTLGLDHGDMLELIEEDKLYKICCNMYALNMLGMVNDLTKGILTIVPKDINGDPITDFNKYTLKDSNGREVKEWVALADYVSSFTRGEDGVPVIPMRYSKDMERKVAYASGGKNIFTSPGTMTKIVEISVILVLAIVLVIILIGRRVYHGIKTGRAARKAPKP